MAVFVDTNILVYADTLAEPHKRKIAQSLLQRIIRDQTGRVSMQVLQEYFAVATRKLKIDSALARRRVRMYARMPVAVLEPINLLEAIDLHRRYKLAIWDALIIRAAMNFRCEKLYSEDLQPGFRMNKLEIVNPFMETVS